MARNGPEIFGCSVSVVPNFVALFVATFTDVVDEGSWIGEIPVFLVVQIIAVVVAFVMIAAAHEELSDDNIDADTAVCLVEVGVSYKLGKLARPY